MRKEGEEQNDERGQVYIDMVTKYEADGVLFHKNLSCHTFSLRVSEIAKRLNQHFGGEFRVCLLHDASHRATMPYRL
jgi:hypothetical protein